MRVYSANLRRYSTIAACSAGVMTGGSWSTGCAASVRIPPANSTAHKARREKRLIFHHIVFGASMNQCLGSIAIVTVLGRDFGLQRRGSLPNRRAIGYI